MILTNQLPPVKVCDRCGAQAEMGPHTKEWGWIGPAHWSRVSIFPAVHHQASDADEFHVCPGCINEVLVFLSRKG